MTVDIIVGATYGNEGKSKFARYYSDNVVKYAGVIKVGGYCTNNFYDWRSDSIMTNHMLPAATGYKDEMYFIFSSATYIDVEMLRKEIEIRKIPNDKVIIDNRARIICSPNLWEYAETQKIDVGTVTDVTQFLAEWDSSARFLVEGQGGYGLAKEFYGEYHKKLPMLPPTMTASGITSLLNIAPTEVDDVILVTRLESERKEFIGGVGDPLATILSGAYEQDDLCICADILSPETEPYNISLVREAIVANDPSILVLNHLDTVESNQDDPSAFTDRQYDVLGWIEHELGVTFDYVGYGEREISELINPESENPGIGDVIDQFNDLLNGQGVGELLSSLGIKEGESIPNDLFLQLMNQQRNDQVMLPPSQVAKMAKNGGTNA